MITQSTLNEPVSISDFSPILYIPWNITYPVPDYWPGDRVAWQAGEVQCIGHVIGSSFIDTQLAPKLGISEIGWRYHAVVDTLKSARSNLDLELPSIGSVVCLHESELQPEHEATSTHLGIAA